MIIIIIMITVMNTPLSFQVKSQGKKLNPMVMVMRQPSQYGHGDHGTS